MAIFGLPAAAGLHGAAGNPRLWMGITAAAVSRRGVPGGNARQRAAQHGVRPRLTGAGPAADDRAHRPAGAGAAQPDARLHRRARRPRRVQLAAAIALGAACAIKATAWPALPVIAAMLAARDGARAATRFAVTAGLTATALVAATAPASVTAPCGTLPEHRALPAWHDQVPDRSGQPAARAPARRHRTRWPLGRDRPPVRCRPGGGGIPSDPAACGYSGSSVATRCHSRHVVRAGPREPLGIFRLPGGTAGFRCHDRNR